MTDKPSVRCRLYYVALALSLLILWSGVHGADGATLIAANEAALPNAPGAILTTRGISLGPSAEQRSPQSDAAVSSPFRLVVSFTGRNGVPIDPSTVTLTYMKAPLVDLTDRVKQYVTAAGIDMPSAEAPPGKHLIRLRFSDKRQRVATEWIEFTGLP